MQVSKQITITLLQSDVETFLVWANSMFLYDIDEDEAEALTKLADALTSELEKLDD